MTSFRGQSSWARTSLGGKLITSTCHPTKKLNQAEQWTYLSTNIVNPNESQKITIRSFWLGRFEFCHRVIQNAKWSIPDRTGFVPELLPDVFRRCRPSCPRRPCRTRPADRWENNLASTVIKLLLLRHWHWRKTNLVFVPGKPFQPSFILVRKAQNLP